jgi:uncharacterized ion transporter superfamily protein YfcC
MQSLPTNIDAGQPVEKDRSGSIPKKKRSLHPVLMLFIAIAIAVGLTWLVPSGRYDRTPEGAVKQDGYSTIVKAYRLDYLWTSGKSTPTAARPASIVDIVAQIPNGFVKQAGLIFMIMFIGGTFAVLRATGAIDAMIDWILASTRNNVYVVTPMIMLVLSTGSTLLGLTSEYIVVIPVIMALGDKLKLPKIYATALVFCAAKVGYMSAVANPLPLVIAQPIVGVPVFSGLGYRFCVWVVLLSVAISYILLYIKRSGYEAPAYEASGSRFPRRHIATLATLILGIAVIAYGASHLKWGNPQMSAFYIVLGGAIGLVGGLDGSRTINAFIDGIRGMCLAGVLIGLAGTLFLILSDSYIIDTIINTLSQYLGGRSPAIVAQLLMLVQMGLDVIIPSTTAQAAVTMPIVGPLAQLSGVSGQVSVLAFLLGSGVMAFLTPTSAYLPAYLATGEIGIGQWWKFIFPFAIMLAILSALAIACASAIGY